MDSHPPRSDSPFDVDQRAVDPGHLQPRGHRTGLRWPACECSGCVDEGGLTWTSQIPVVSAAR